MSLFVQCTNPHCCQRLLRADLSDTALCPHCQQFLPPLDQANQQEQPMPGRETLAYVSMAQPVDAASTLNSLLILGPVASTWQQAQAATDLQGHRDKTGHGHHPMAEQEQDGPGQLGRFHLRRLLGQGSFGKVWEAYDPHLDRVVAIKVAKTQQLGNGEGLKRFLREAKAAAGLRHPGILPVFDAGQEGDRFFIATAYITGDTLENALAEHRPNLLDSVQIVRRLAEALAYAHNIGIVHRDLKPANIMLDERGQPILLDFGLAFRHEPGERLTREGDLMGTPLYMAPEQASGRHQDTLPASDQYSLGIVFFELLTGRTPFIGPGPLAMIHHIQSMPPRPSDLDPRIPFDLEDICLQCLEKDPAGRYPSCQALAEDLNAWLEQHAAEGPNTLITGPLRWDRQESLQERRPRKFDLQRLEHLEKENQRLKKLLAEAELEKAILKEHLEEMSQASHPPFLPKKSGKLRQAP